MAVEQYERALLTGLRRLMERLGYDGPLTTPEELREALRRFHTATAGYPACVVWTLLAEGKEIW